MPGLTETQHMILAMILIVGSITLYAYLQVVYGENEQ